MSKFVVFIVLAVTYCSGNIINVPINYNNEFLLQDDYDIQNLKESELKPHLMDFIKLIDIEKIIRVSIQYMHDTEVIKFIGFIVGPEFKKIIIEIEEMEEFKEIYMFLSTKGYDMEMIMNYINSALKLPPFEKPARVATKQNGISGLIAAVIDTLPLQEMKELFETKLENNPEVAYLFETLRSTEFTDIIVRMSKNPKMIDFKIIFESYGIDFSFICGIVKEIFGDYYLGILCKS